MLPNHSTVFGFTSALAEYQNLQEDADKCAGFGPFAYALALLYAITLFFTLRHSFRKKERACVDNSFTAFLVLNNLSRITFFVSWAILHRDECPTMVITKENRDWVAYFSNIPAHFYITAFSFVVYKFSVVFHRVVRTSKRDNILSTMFSILLFVSNSFQLLSALATYVQITWFLDSKDAPKLSWIQTVELEGLIVVSSITALSLLLYGIALFYHFHVLLKSRRENVSTGVIIESLHDDDQYQFAQNIDYTMAPQENNRFFGESNGQNYQNNQNSNNRGGQIVGVVGGGGESGSNLPGLFNPSLSHHSQKSNSNSTQPSQTTTATCVQSSTVSSSNPQSSQQLIQLQQSQQDQFASRASHNLIPTIPTHTAIHSTYQHNQHNTLQIRTGVNNRNDGPSGFNSSGSPHPQFNSISSSGNTKRSDSPAGNNSREMFGTGGVFGTKDDHNGDKFQKFFQSQVQQHKQQSPSGQHSSVDYSSFGSGLRDSGEFHSLDEAQRCTQSSLERNLEQSFDGNIDESSQEQINYINYQNNQQNHFQNQHNNNQQQKLSNRNYTTQEASSRSTNLLYTGRNRAHIGSNGSSGSNLDESCSNSVRGRLNTPTFGTMTPLKSLRGNKQHSQSRNRNINSSRGDCTAIGHYSNRNGDSNNQINPHSTGSLGLSYNTDDSSHIDAPLLFNQQDSELGTHHKDHNDMSYLVNQNSTIQASQSTVHFNGNHDDDYNHYNHNGFNTCNDENGGVLKQKNRMARPFIVSLCSAICFIIRVVLLILMSNDKLQQGPEVILFYSCCSEVIPLNLLWLVFDDPSLQGQEKSKNNQHLSRHINGRGTQSENYGPENHFDNSHLQSQYEGYNYHTMDNGYQVGHNYQQQYQQQQYHDGDGGGEFFNSQILPLHDSDLDGSLVVDDPIGLTISPDDYAGSIQAAN